LEKNLPVVYSLKKGGEKTMKKWLSLLLALALFAIFSAGCSGVSRETKIKCPKCGAIFTIDEGLSEIQKKGGGAGS